MEREHIALTEAQIIAAEKGELQLETRNGEKIVQLVWFRPPYEQVSGYVLEYVNEFGDKRGCCIDGSYDRGCSKNDLFVSEPKEQTEPKPLYEVGEIIEVDVNGVWTDAEHRDNRNGFVIVWINGRYASYYDGLHRKKQKTVTLENKVMTVRAALQYLANI